ncbi:adenosylcobinamide-phosphate synthase CbiB [Roseibium suaedae]|uniref:Cobalamin biosynthesis protein CobD n=1 Tax=Roseibium suaedae TaxID=735517 RepID=A0A1M7F6Z8_9HYPH|nr:adenosylcobinamide-phosphate synthase CbiB [Roseibium suaedae]SHL99844.1 adenosylcobinamide-phosphate synthase [Roseibium suaedae]
MLTDGNALFLLLAALTLDALVGDPDWLWRRLPHPVVWIGKLISSLETRLNSTSFSPATRKRNGVLTLLILLSGSLVLGFFLTWLSNQIAFGSVITILIVAVLIAQKSLFDHVASVRDGLRQGGLGGGRKAVAMIVGRDPEQLDEAGVSRAAIESCAENFSDGIVAPVFWFAVLGLPGLITYKAVNTADSMIGHKNERYQDFGWASARFDDLINLPASRLAGLFIAGAAGLAKGSPLHALRIMIRDAGQHRSPNAGWPEAAMAGALGLALAGPRVYTGYKVEDPYMNPAGRRDANAEDIAAALRVYMGACAIQALIIAILSLVWW